MITGIVTNEREAVVPLTISGPGGKEQSVDAVIDTGFDGWLSLPGAIIALLKLIWLRRSSAVLADGSTTFFDVYIGTVVWDGRRRQIAVDEGESAPLVGMALLEGYEFNAQIRPGGKVTIKPLPRRSTI